MRTLRIQAVVLIVALILQYAVGMYVNLFVPFPEGQTEDQLWEFAWSQPALALHIIFAFLILFGAIMLCIRAARAREKKWIVASGVGLLAIFAAGGSGASFIPSQNDLYSYSMALAFLIALLAYGLGLFTTRQHTVNL